MKKILFAALLLLSLMVCLAPPVWTGGLDDAKAYYNRGAAWTEKHDYDKAIADYTKAIEFNPKHYGAYYNRGDAWYSNGDYDKVIADFTKTIEIDPKCAKAYYSRGLARKQKGNNYRANADYNKAIELNPELRQSPQYQFLVVNLVGT